MYYFVLLSASALLTGYNKINTLQILAQKLWNILRHVVILSHSLYPTRPCRLVDAQLQYWCTGIKNTFNIEYIINRKQKETVIIVQLSLTYLITIHN